MKWIMRWSLKTSFKSTRVFWGIMNARTRLGCEVTCKNLAHAAYDMRRQVNAYFILFTFYVANRLRITELLGRNWSFHRERFMARGKDPLRRHQQTQSDPCSLADVEVTRITTALWHSARQDSLLHEVADACELQCHIAWQESDKFYHTNSRMFERRSCLYHEFRRWLCPK